MSYFRIAAKIVRPSILLSVLLIGVTENAKCQNARAADSLFKEARELAFQQKDFARAITIAKTGVRSDTNYIDLYIFLGRLYAWTKEADSSRMFFQKALGKKKVEDAYAGYADMEIWNGNESGALSVLDAGLVYNTASVPLLIRKARILNERKDFRNAASVVDDILKIDRNNTEARMLGERIRDNVSRNRIGIYVDYIYFDKQFPDPWLQTSIDYTRQTQAGAFTGRINYAQRFNKEGFQFELDAYPRLSKRFYTYLNIALSDAVIFPKQKAGASLYASLPRAFEAELGIRYLYFNSSTFIYTASIGKYLGKFFFNGRVYLTPGSNTIAQSYILSNRYYYGGLDDYIGLNLGAGISPDDRQSYVQLNSNYKLKTYRGEVVLRHSIRKLNIITANASLVNQEYLPNTVGNQIQVGLGYIRRF